MRSLILRFGSLQALITATGGILAPVMYLLFADKGLRLDQIGVLVAIATATAMFFEIPFGVLADNYGRKRVFMAGEVLLLVVAAGLWLADGFLAIAFFMALSGMSTALFSGTLDALFVQKFNALREQDPSLDLQRAQAGFGIFQVLGIAIGSVLAGFLPGWLEGLSASSEWVDFYDVNCLIMIPLILMHMGLTAVFVDDPRPPRDAAPRPGLLRTIVPFTRTAAGVLRSSKTLQMLLVIELIGGAAMISLEQLWQPRLAQIVDAKDSTWIFGALFAMNYVFMAIGQGLSIPAAKLFRQRYDAMLIVVEVALAGLFVLFALQQSLTGFIVAYAMLFLVAGMALSPFLTMFHTVVPEAHRSTMLSTKSFFTQTGAMGGALLAGVLAQNFGIHVAWMVAGGVMLVSAAMYLTGPVRRLAVDLAASASSPAEQPPALQQGADA